jgi:hypothetical protein
MAGTILTGNLSLDLLKIPVQKFFGLAYEDWDSKYDKIFEVIKTDERFARDVIAAGMSIAALKTEAQAPIADGITQGWSKLYEAQSYGLYTTVSKEAIDDTHDLKPLADGAAALKKGCMLTTEINAHNVLNRSVNASYLGGDGVTLANSAHPTASGVTYKNTPTTSADMSEAILEQAYIDIRSLIDERNNPALAVPRSLVICKENRLETHRVLNSVLRYQTSDNDPNAIRDLNIFPEVVETPYITGSTQQFWITTSIPNGLKLYMREEISVDVEDVPLEKAVRLIAFFRMIASWTDPRGVYYVPGV